MFYTIACFIAKYIFLLAFRVKLINVDNFNNTKGRCIICCNHISNFDPLMLACFTKRQISFMAKKELFKVPVLKTLVKWLNVFPVDRTGVSVSSMKHAVSILKEDRVLGIFPEGTRVKGYDENNAKAGISMIANMANSLIIPVFIRSEYRLFSKIEIIFGEPTNYFTSIEGRISSEMHMQIGKQILRDIYSFEDKLS